VVDVINLFREPIQSMLSFLVSMLSVMMSALSIFVSVWMLYIQYAWEESFRKAKYVTKRARKRHRTRKDVTKVR
jgi:hypothetical protein